jgi:hypothetical protein
MVSDSAFRCFSAAAEGTSVVLTSSPARAGVDDVPAAGETTGAAANAAAKASMTGDAVERFRAMFGMCFSLGERGRCE